MENAVLSPSCSRRPGNTCSFSCVEGYIPLTSNNLVCGSDGTWNQNTNNLCSSKIKGELKLLLQTVLSSIFINFN